MSPQNTFGELMVQEPTSMGVRTRILPTYTCGHCTNVVVMRPDRTRPRNFCHSCSKWICETKELCNLQCTPLYSLAEDHFEGGGRHATLVHAIMGGAETLAEAQEKGLLPTTKKE